MNIFDNYKLELEIVPGVLETEWEEIEKKLELVKPFAKTIHIDLLDGKFAGNTTFSDPAPFRKFAKDFILELHMMVEDPIQYLQPFAEAGFTRFIGHVERMPDIVAFVAQGQLLGEVGLALDKQTAVDSLQVSLEDLDVVTVMTIQAGFSGQSFDESLLTKIQQLREKSSFIPIEVDGGISDKTIKKAKDAGATRFVANSFLFSATPSERFQSLVDLTEK